MSHASLDGEVRDLCAEFLDRYADEAVTELVQHFPQERQSLVVDFEDVVRFNPDLADDLLAQPAYLRDHFESALADYDVPIDVDLDAAHVRFANLNEARRFRVGEYRSDSVHDLIGVTGQIRQATQLKTELEEATFECQRCGTAIQVPQDRTNEVQEPHECPGCERQGPYTIDFRRSAFRDVQQLQLKQPPEETAGGNGATVTVVLRDDLPTPLDPDAGFRPGDRVTVTGELRLATDAGDDGYFDKYVEGDHVALEETDFQSIDIDAETEQDIKALARGDRGHPIDLLAESIAPSLFGYETIKEALVLQLFGGSEATHPDGSGERGDSHVLLLGDPGCGKSSLLQAVEAIAPRAIYSSGKGASASGLTAAAVPSDFGGDKWQLEAGALVLANNGIACIDEIDKMDESAVKSMHEALEDQRVNINKAGINTTLPAETSLLAAGNPVYGRFDRYEPIGEQIDLDPALMSRFDLMFMLSDTPDPEEDQEVAEHMLDRRSEAIAYSAGEMSSPGETIAPAVDAELFRAYVAYAKQTVTPRIVDEDVKRILKGRYAAWREQGIDEDAPVPVTARSLEALMRLAEASARARLQEEVAPEDAKRAIELVETSLEQVGIDPETGEMDADVIETGTSKTQHDRKKAIKAAVQELQTEYDQGAPADKVIERLVDEGFENGKVADDIETLAERGVFYQPEDGYLRMI